MAGSASQQRIVLAKLRSKATTAQQMTSGEWNAAETPADAGALARSPACVSHDGSLAALEVKVLQAQCDDLREQVRLQAIQLRDMQVALGEAWRDREVASQQACRDLMRAIESGSLVNGDDARALQSRVAALSEELDQMESRHEVVCRDLAQLQRVHAALVERSETLDSTLSQLKSELEDLRRERTEATTREQELMRQRDQSLKAEESQVNALRAAQSALEIERALARQREHRQEQLELLLMQARRRGDDLVIELGRAQQGMLAAENQVARTRATISFRLGYSLIHSFKSPTALVRLPGQLISLVNDSRKNRTHKRTQQLALDQAASRKLLAYTTPADPMATDRIRPGTTATACLAQVTTPGALRALKVAAIMDDFTHASYAPECNLLQLSVDHWTRELETFQPELLLIESAWRGKDDQWGSRVGHLSSEVMGILDWCRSRDVPTAFWNKEDPVHFETFLNTARLFDHVFTTDVDCIHRYKGALGHDRVHLLPFACQPRLSNPIETYERKDAFCFAGAYYVRYPERTRDLGNFLVSLSAFKPIEIYDRNFGKDDVNYRFPAEYQPFIVGTLPFDQIDRAYKGYRYAINLNSIKQSQSMFARRVFELLACNTMAVSNFSRGLRLMFGDLVVTSDSGEELVRRLRSITKSPIRERQHRLRALRKVMREHTYQDRLAYIVSRIRQESVRQVLPNVLMAGHARDEVQLRSIIEAFQRQEYPHRHLLVVVPNTANLAALDSPGPERIRVVTQAEAADMPLCELTPPDTWVAGIVADDYYGPHYLTDLAIATRYARGSVIGKGVQHVWSPSAGLLMRDQGRQYQEVSSLMARSAIVRTDTLLGVDLHAWVRSLYTRELEVPHALAIDEFNYCRDGARAFEVPAQVDDAPTGDEGLPWGEMLRVAESTPAQESRTDMAPSLSGSALSQWFSPPKGKPWSASPDGDGWRFESALGDGKHDYLYATQDLSPEELHAERTLRFHLDVSPGLNVQFVALFLDEHKQRISHVVQTANRNHEVALPAGTVRIRIGLRLYGSGSAEVRCLVLGHRPLRPGALFGRSPHLVLTNHYPAYDDLYRNAFVHTRMCGYRERGVSPDVFRLRSNEAPSYHEFQNQDVMTGSEEALHKLLSRDGMQTVLVHFLDPVMWAVLQSHLRRLRVVVWVHGADIQPWYRREHNITDDTERNAAIASSDKRMAFWKSLLGDMHPNLHLVFVSQHFADEVMEDLGFAIPPDRYSIIHNPIDVDLFRHEPKPAEQRLRILSIRPYSSRTYANDLSVEVIRTLVSRPCFPRLEFLLVGDGKLFDATLQPLQGLENVQIRKGYLTRADIATLHRQFGLFLVPTRMDTQGVSRDEAMASGLVPITNAVAAVPEFVDAESGCLAPAEDARAMAQDIEALVSDPDRFERMSSAAAERVRRQSAQPLMINAELALFCQPSGTAKHD